MMIGRSMMRALGLTGLALASAGGAQVAPAPATPTATAPAAQSGVVPPPAPAQDPWPAGSGISNAMRTRGEVIRATYMRALSFAACAFSERDAERVLGTPIGSPEEEREITHFLRGNLRCADAARGVSVRLMRAAMAEQLLKRRPPEPGTPFKLTPAVFDGAADKQLVTAAKLAQCHVDAQPVAARQVLATVPGSPEELRAEMGLFIAAPTCAGTALPAALPPVIYRGLLATALASGQAVRS